MKIRRWLPYVAAIPATAAAWTPPTERPDPQLEAFVCSEQFEVTAWASSPDFFNPTNIDIDHRGRMWVLEGVNYRRKADRRPEGDRIMILEDSNGDGKADKSTVFWQDPELLAPLGIAVFDNVVLVSQPPHLLKLTDANRDGKFDPADGDTREVLLTGFNGRNHDHSLHSVTGGPDGKWYFNQGNCGAIFEDRSGRRFPVGSAYYQSGGGEWPSDTRAASGEASADGFVYVGGFTVRMNPDATAAEIIGHNYRNSYEQTITSLGDVFQNDNDDPPACRVTHVLEHGNAGFFSRDGKRNWGADRRPGQDVPTAQWRQDDPGTMPAGDVYGGGSPTGIAFYENGAMGDAFSGTLLSCEPGRNVIFSYQPARKGSSYGLERTDFLTTNPEKTFDGSDFVGGVKLQKDKPVEEVRHFLFRPSDVCVGPDGALYVSDWNDPRVGGHDTQNEQATGIIYRIAPKGFKPEVPKLDLDTIAGAVEALKSPAVNTRWLGFQRLRAAGDAAFEPVAKVLEESNPHVAARAIWLLPYLGQRGQAKIDELLSSGDEGIRLTAFRAVRRTDGVVDDYSYAVKLAGDESPAVRAEAALAMRSRGFEQAREVLVKVAEGYDGKDRAYLDMLGLGAGKNNDLLWKTLSEAMKPGEPSEWSEKFARLTWRLMPNAAVNHLKARASHETVADDQRKLATDSLAFIDTSDAAAALMELAAEGSPVRQEATRWLLNRNEGEWASMALTEELRQRGILKEPVKLVSVTVPGKPESTKFSEADVLGLKGDAARGKAAAARCVMCHRIENNGPEYGPELKGFASRQPPEVIARAIVNPSNVISHGYEGTAIRLKNGDWIDGLVLSEGDTVTIRSTGGLTQKVPKGEIAERKKMDRSLMLNADQLGLSAQEVADIIEWMKTY
jgi:putative membrane-bound dehydrogenase-like protein